mmetsp:Transcript_112294/g.356840  ORF Transcript_112294/g.356840 Transcript_112294/m.356840 type:complete len:236 (+) Transcript_112294:1078-1785(+)
MEVQDEPSTGLDDVDIVPLQQCPYQRTSSDDALAQGGPLCTQRSEIREAAHRQTEEVRRLVLQESHQGAPTINGIQEHRHLRRVPCPRVRGRAQLGQGFQRLEEPPAQEGTADARRAATSFQAGDDRSQESPAPQAEPIVLPRATRHAPVFLAELPPPGLRECQPLPMAAGRRDPAKAAEVKKPEDAVKDLGGEAAQPCRWRPSGRDVTRNLRLDPGLVEEHSLVIGSGLHCQQA